MKGGQMPNLKPREKCKKCKRSVHKGGPVEQCGDGHAHRACLEVAQRVESYHEREKRRKVICQTETIGDGL